MNNQRTLILCNALSEQHTYTQVSRGKEELGELGRSSSLKLKKAGRKATVECVRL